MAQKSDKASEPTAGKTPCLGYHDRPFHQKIRTFIFPVAYASPCSGLGENTGEAIETWGKKRASALANSSPGEATPEMIKQFTPNAYRANMTKLQLGKDGGTFPSHFEAHHLMPKKFVDEFLEQGVWVHDPRLLLPVNKPIHSRIHYRPGDGLLKWNKEWVIFYRGNREAILQKAKRMIKDYN